MRSRLLLSSNAHWVVFGELCFVSPACLTGRPSIPNFELIGGKQDINIYLLLSFLSNVEHIMGISALAVAAL